MKRFFCLTFCFVVFPPAFTVVTPPAQPVPVMPAPLPPAQNAAKPTTPVLPTPAASTVTPVSAPIPASTPVSTSAPVPAITPVSVITPVPAVASTQAPTPVPAPTSSTSSVAVPTTSPVPSGQNKPEAPAAVTTASSNEKEFDELYQKLNQVAAIKKELKRQLGEIEEKLDAARKMAIESKEASFKIVQQSKTAEAEALVAQVEKNLQSLTETQKKLNDIDLPKFEDSAKKIQEIMQVIQSKMTELESKGLKLQISQAQLELQKKNSLAQETVSEKGTAPQATAVKAQTEKTISQKLYQFTIDSLASGISKTKRAWQNFRDWVYSKPEESSEVKKNSKPIVLDSESAIKNLIEELDGILKQFDEIQIAMLQKYTNIKSKAKNLEIRLKSNDDIRKYFERLDEQNPAWKDAAIKAFSSAIDGVYTIGKATKKTAHIVYDKFLKGFVSDVKSKVHEQEKQPEKPLGAQPKDLEVKIATVPEMQVPAVK